MSSTTAPTPVHPPLRKSSLSRISLRSGWELLAPEFKKKLLEVKIKDILPRFQPLIIARSTDTIATVFSRLIENDIFSVPLLDIDADRYVAFIDIFDILAFVVQNIHPEGHPTEEELLASELFQTTSCLALVGKSSRSTWYLIGEHVPIQAAINEMRYSRRLAVLDHQGNMISLLTQSKVTRWLAKQHETVLGQLASRPVADIDLGFGEVVVANHREKVVRAFLRMYEMDVSGLAVVDDEGTVIGNISISDLKDIGYDGGVFSRMYMTCGDFLERKVEGLLVPKLVAANPSTTVKELLEMFRNHRIHRVYIISRGSGTALGVCTTTDLMNLFSVPPPVAS